MGSESRLKKLIRNLGWHFIYEVIRMVFVFLLPKYIIEFYGSEVNGLTSTVNTLVTLVSLVQAGISTAATFYLYKPLENNDRVEITSYLLSARRLYRRIALLELGLGAVASAIISISIDSEIQPIYIFSACFIVCLNTAITMFFSPVHNIFFGATQNRHIINKISIVTALLSYGLQIVVLVLKAHFMWLYVITVITGVVGVILSAVAFRKQYASYRLTEEEKKLVTRKRIRGMGYASINEVSHSVVTACMVLGVSLLCGLAPNSVLSVYITVNNTLLVVGTIIYSSFAPSFGSVVAEGNIGKLNRVFEIFQFVFITVSTFLSMTALYLLLPFVKIYSAAMTDAEYVNFLLALFIIIYNMFYSFRIPYNIAVSTSGLFKQTYLQPLISAGVAVVMIFTLTLIRFEFVLLGPIAFYIANTFYQHFKLKKCINGFDNDHFWRHFAVSVICFGISLAAFLIFPIYPESFLKWALLGVGTAVCSAVVLFCTILLFDRNSLKKTVNYFFKR